MSDTLFESQKTGICKAKLFVEIFLFFSLYLNLISFLILICFAHDERSNLVQAFTPVMIFQYVVFGLSVFALFWNLWSTTGELEHIVLFIRSKIFKSRNSLILDWGNNMFDSHLSLLFIFDSCSYFECGYSQKVPE